MLQAVMNLISKTVGSSRSARMWRVTVSIFYDEDSGDGCGPLSRIKTIPCSKSTLYSKTAESLSLRDEGEVEVNSTDSSAC